MIFSRHSIPLSLINDCHVQGVSGSQDACWLSWGWFASEHCLHSLLPSQGKKGDINCIFQMLIFCMYIYVQNFLIKSGAKSLSQALKEYQFTIVNDCELHLHLTLVLSTALNKEHTMTIFKFAKIHNPTRFKMLQMVIV